MSYRHDFQKIEVNADDFGMSPSVNRAIVLAFDKGLITRTSIMTNMPGFEEACALAHEERLVERMGIHLNLTEGHPLTERIAKRPRFCNESGAFVERKITFWLNKEERTAVEEELEAQISACSARGIAPTHLDSHHHYHHEWAIATLVLRVAKRHGIERIRLFRNCSPRVGAAKKLYKLIYNSRLKMHRLAGSRYFGSVDEVRPILATLRGDVEVMVHPRLSESGLLVDMYLGELQPLIESLGVSDLIRPRR